MAAAAGLRLGGAGAGGMRLLGAVLVGRGVLGSAAPQLTQQLLHTSGVQNSSGSRKWEANNRKKYPPTPLGEEERHAFVCHVKKNIKYSPDKMWYVACLVRGLRIDDAIAQLKFVHKKGAVAAIETLEEARQMAVEEHHVEYPSNLWVAESFVGKGIVFKGMRRHARRRFGKVEYKHCHYFVTLEEGDPPVNYYYYRRQRTPEELVQEYLEDLRKRTIPRSL